MTSDFLIPNPQKIEDSKKAFKLAGPDSIHVLSDFDRTLTKAFVNGKKIPSLIAILRDFGFLTPDYPKQAATLFEKYHTYEMDPNLALAEKKKLMEEWWTKHFKLLIDSGLTKNDIKKAVDMRIVEVRRGVTEFFDLLKNHSIPLIIMSSSGMGLGSINMFLEEKNLFFENIQIIANQFIWDENDKAMGIKKPIIHLLNKTETLIQNFPAYELVKNRKNVILLGDNQGDLGMVEGFEYSNLLTIGFLNEKVEENLENFKKVFDVIIVNDGDFGYINETLKEILTK